MNELLFLFILHTADRLKVESPEVSSRRTFLRPVLRGKRFDSHAVPLEVLADLATYRELVVAIARAMFLREHPGRARAPKGFEEKFSLVLRTVEGGSAAPVLEREYFEWPDTPFTHAEPANDQFEAARDAANAMLADVVSADGFAAEYPPKVRSLIARLGRNLRAGESVEFCLPGQNSGPRLSQELFSKLGAAEPVAFEEQIEVDGYIEAVDVNQRRMKIRTADGLIPAPLPLQFEKAAIDGLKDHEGHAYRIKGSAHLDLTRTLIRFAVLTSVDPIADTLEMRIAELRAVQPGWLGGVGESLHARTATWLEEVRRASLIGSFPLPPSLFPTPEGGARAEWQIDKWSVSAEFEPTNGTAYFHALNLESDVEIDKHVTGVQALIEAVAVVEEGREPS